MHCFVTIRERNGHKYIIVEAVKGIPLVFVSICGNVLLYL